MTSISGSTKITEISDKSACAVWSPVTSGMVALGAKVSELYFVSLH